MPTKPKLRFSIATLLWLMVCVAMFLGGRWSREIGFLQQQARIQAQERQLMDASVAARELEHKIAELLDSKKLGPWIGDVTDGDSISAIANGRLVRVRILGIDCPELNQPFGDEAKQFTTDFCMNKTVKLVRDVVDRDGRLLADVTVGGQSLLEALLSAGLAWHYKEYRDDPDLSELEDEAQAAKRGLWADEDAVPPWDWRKWQALTERRRTAVNLDLESIDKAGAQN